MPQPRSAPALQQCSESCATDGCDTDGKQWDTQVARRAHTAPLQRRHCIIDTDCVSSTLITSNALPGSRHTCSSSSAKPIHLQASKRCWIQRRSLRASPVLSGGKRFCQWSSAKKASASAPCSSVCQGPFALYRLYSVPPAAQASFEVVTETPQRHRSSECQQGTDIGAAAACWEQSSCGCLFAASAHKLCSTCASSRRMARKAYSPRPTRLLRAAPISPVAAVMKVNSPAPKNA